MTIVSMPTSECFIKIGDTPIGLDVLGVYDWLMSQFHFVSMTDTDEIMYYHNGVYHPNGEKVINKVLENAFGRLRDMKNKLILTGRFKSQIRNKIRDNNYMDRSKFDSDKHIINMKNGLFNWKTMELSPHTPNYKSIIQIPVEYDPSVDCPNIKRSFSAVFEETDLIKFREFIAYCLYNGYPIQKAFILYSPGDTGKALEIHTPIPTPTGYVEIQNLNPGDEVFDEDGNICHVVAKTPIFKNRKVYEVYTADGESIIADENHLWKFHPDWDKEYVIKNTKQLYSASRSRYCTIRAQGALNLPDANLSIDPYLLGMWLGNGTSIRGEITCNVNDVEFVKKEITKAGYEVVQHKNNLTFGVKGLTKQLEQIGVLAKKHIPMMYLRASKNQRLALLQGLIDSDGHVDPRQGTIEYCTINKVLAGDVRELIQSLGIKANITVGDATLNGKFISKKYRIFFMMKDAAKLPRKSAFCKDATIHRDRSVKVRPCGIADTICIQVDSHNGMFLAGRSFLPTHNSFVMNIVRQFLGVEHCTDVSIHKLTTNRFAGFNLVGKLLNSCGDLDNKALSSLDEFKKATSGLDPINCEEKGKTAFEYVNTAKFLFGANRLNKTNDASVGFFRRIEIIHTKKKLIKKGLPTIDEVTTPNELSGLFNWVIGYLEPLLERKHFKYESQLDEIKHTYIAASDPISSFISSRLVEKPGMRVVKDDVYEAFLKYCEDNNVFEIPDKTTFWREVWKVLPRLQEGEKVVAGKRKNCIRGYDLVNEGYENI